MAYGNLSVPVTGYTKTIHYSLMFTGDPLTLISPDRHSYHDYFNPAIFRFGGNTPNFNSPRTKFELPYYELESYRKLIGYVIRQKKVKYYERSKKDPNISIRKTKKVLYDKKVFGLGIRWKKKKRDASQPSDLLFQPNPLSYSQQFFTISEPVIVLQRKLGNGAGEYYYDDKIEIVGLPQDLVVRNADGVPIRDISGATASDFINHPPTTGLPEGLADEALRKLYSKVADEFPDYITDVIQVKSTWKTITKIARSAISVVYAMKKLDLQRLRGTLPGITPKDISNLWLEFIYGVTPVLDDVDKSIDLYTRQTRRWRSYSASTRSETVVERPRAGNIPISGRVGYQIREKVVTKYTVRYGVIMTGDQSFVRKVRKDSTMLSAFSTAYQIIPYSFCIDWIYNLGGYLQAKDSMDDYRIYQWRTVIVDQTIERTFTLNSFSNDGIVDLSGTPSFKINSRRLTVNRDPTINLPSMPTPRKKRVEEIFSFKRSLNALALFTQLLSRK